VIPKMKMAMVRHGSNEPLIDSATSGGTQGGRRQRFERSPISDVMMPSSGSSASPGAASFRRPEHQAHVSLNAESTCVFMPKMLISTESPSKP
jgi:hypothetical protein